MPKKTDKPTFEVPNYEKLTTIEDVDKEIESHKQKLVGKDIIEYRMKEDKKDYVGALNEQLKELKEEREHEINVLSALNQHKQLIANQGGQIIPMPMVKAN